MTSDTITVEKRLHEAIQVAYANAPAVQAHFDAAGVNPADIRTVDDLARVPVLPKDKVIAMQQANPPFGGLLAVPMSQVRHIFFSPGPLYEPDTGDLSSLLDMTQLCLQRIGFEAGDIVLNCLSYHLVPAGSLLDHGLTSMGCTVIPGGVGNSELQVKMMLDLGVTGYTGTPSFLMTLIEKAEAMGLDFKRDFRLKKALVTAEPLPPELRHTFTSKYGLRLGNGYTTAELGFIAINVDGGMAMALLPEPIIQIVDPDTGQNVGPGEAGEVVVTNLSHAYPLIRLGTGDLAINVDANPGQSRQEERAIILVGRCGEAVKVRGMFVHPNQLRFAAVQVPGVKALHAVVSRPDNQDYLTLKVVLEEGKEPTAVAETLKETVRAICRVRVNEVEFVPADSLPADGPGIVDERNLFDSGAPTGHA